VHTNEKHQCPWQHASKYRHDETSWRHKLAVEIAENWNAEPFEDIIDVEETGKHLGKVADNVVPAHWSRVPKEMTSQTELKAQCI